MNFIDFILLMLSCAAVTWTFVQSTIVDKIGLRPLWEKSQFLKELWNCGFCGGFHVGIYWGLFCFWLNHIQSQWFYILTIPFTAACFSFLFERLLVLIINVDEGVEKRNKKE